MSLVTKDKVPEIWSLNGDIVSSGILCPFLLAL